MKRMRLIFAAPLLALLLACSLPPASPVTRRVLMETGVYRDYVIEQSPEMVLDALNAEGEVILEGKTNIRGVVKQEVYIKILATPEGLEVQDYKR